MNKPFRIIRPSQLAEMLSLSLVSIWRMEKRGELPPRKKISKRAVGWLESDLVDWMRDRPDALLTEKIEGDKK